MGAFFPKPATKERRKMAEQAKNQTQNNQQPQQPKPAPGPKRQVTLDQMLDAVCNMPAVLDEDNDEITLKTKDLALFVVAMLEISDLNLLRAVLRRRRDNSRFHDAVEMQPTNQ